MTGRGKEVLVNWLTARVKLTGKDAAEYKRLLELEENKEVEKMDTSYLGRAEARGVKKGAAQAEAQAVEKMRQAVLQGLEQRFGAIPKQVQRRLEATRSLERLAALVEKLLSADTVEDLVSLGRPASN